MTDNTPDELKPTETDDDGRREESDRGTERKGSVVLFGDLTDIAPECPYCGTNLQRENAEGAWLECPSGDYSYDSESGEAYARDHGDPMTYGGREASSVLFDRWMGKAAENIDEWGLQAEETLLLAIQEELGELSQAHLEARAEGGDPERVDEELDDIGPLLLQLHERRQQDGRTCVYCGKGDDAYGDNTTWYKRNSDGSDAHRRCSPRP